MLAILRIGPWTGADDTDVVRQDLESIARSMLSPAQQEDSAKDAAERVKGSGLSRV